MQIHSHQKYIEGVQQRDRQIIHEIYQEFFPSIERYVKNNRGHTDDAHDIFQEGMQMLYHKATTTNFEITSGLNNWLFIVCRNIWLKKLNKKGKMPVTSTEELDLTSEEDTEKQIIANERKQLYLKKFQLLSEMCQKILTLFFDKIKMADIAKQLDYKNANVVKKKKAMCQKKLVQLIQTDPLFNELKL